MPSNNSNPSGTHRNPSINSNTNNDYAALLKSDKIMKILNSDIAINALLLNFKQILLNCEEFIKYLRKKYQFEQDYFNELSKHYKNFFVNSKTTNNNNSNLYNTFNNIITFDSKISKIKQSYIKSLIKIYDELNSLLLTMTKLRKSIKENSKKLEKDVSDSIHIAEKAKSKYLSLCQDWDKLKTIDPTKTKLTLRGSKTTKEQEEDLLKKIDQADFDYKQKVDHSNNLRNQFLNKERPKIIQELKNLIMEFSIAISIQLQKYSILTENSYLNIGLIISPIDINKSMKSIASSVSMEKDLYNFLNKYNSKNKQNLLINKNLIPVTYKKHPSMASNFPSSFNSSTTNTTTPITPLNNSNTTTSSTTTTTNRTSPNRKHTNSSLQSSNTANSPIISPSTNKSSLLTTSATIATSTNNNNKSISNSSKLNNTLSTPISISNPILIPSTSKQTEQLFNLSSPSVIDDSTNKDLDLSTPSTRQPSQLTTNTNTTTNNNVDSTSSERPLSKIDSITTNLPPGINKNFRTFGVSLDTLIQFEEDSVPSIVRQCIYIIDKYGLDIEGIYRKSANVTEVSKLKDEIDKDPSNISMLLPPKNFNDSDIHLVASIFKLFFASLPNTLIPSEIVPELKICISIEDFETRKNYMHGLIYKFPDAQYWTLRSLLFHLKRVAGNKDKNKMNEKALCIIWGPSIIPPNDEDHNDVNFQINNMQVLLNVTEQAFEPEE